MSNDILRVLNYKAAKIKLNPDDIPTLINKKVLQEWQKNDPAPYYKIQKIDFPIKANGVNYLESFFESYINKMKDRPIPGAKDGHEMMWGKRPNTDFIMVGGKIESNGKGKGSVYFKNYIPPEGSRDSNEIFIRENKSDMVHFSLVAYVKEEREETSDGVIINIVESLYGERNDAVEWGTGAMQQKTNMKDLLNPDNPDVKDISSKGDKDLDKEELLKILNASKANAISISEVAKAMGQEDQLLTKEHTDALKTVNKLQEMGIKDPIKELKTAHDKIKADAEIVRNAELDAAFGSNSSGKNTLRQYAGMQCKGLEGDELKNAIEELREDPIAKELNARQLDYTTEENNLEEKIGLVETKKANISTDNEVEKIGSVKVDSL